METDVWANVLLAAEAIREPLLPLWAMELLASLFFYAWLFCVGATIGSFLNVVVYRLPRGKNLAYPGSCCPRCGHPIRLADNIPILSWLLLRGRCRDCQAPIASRYFWIELLVASMFLGVAFWERTSFIGAWGHEVRPPLSPYDHWPYWSRYATHVVLLTTLLGGSLIMGDHFATSPKLFLPAIVLGLLLPLIWPAIRSVPAWNYGKLPDWQAGLIDGLAALTIGTLPALLAIAWRQYSPHSRPTFSPLSWMAAFALVLGWQRALLWSAPALLIYLVFVGCLRSWGQSTAAQETETGNGSLGRPQPIEEITAPESPSPTAEEPPLP